MCLQYKHVLLAFCFIQKAFPVDIFVKPGDTAQLICPYNTSITWSNSTTAIVVDDDVADMKYSVYNDLDTESSTLKIKNFSHTDVDTYICNTIQNNTVFQKKIVVKLCNVPQETTFLQNMYVTRRDRNSDNYKDILCKTGSKDGRADMKRSHDQEQVSTISGDFDLYSQNITCSVLDNAQCVIQEAVEIDIFWKQNVVIKANASVVIDCFCYPSELEATSNRMQNKNESVKGYLYNHSLYLMKFPTLSARYCHCIQRTINTSSRLINDQPGRTTSKLLFVICLPIVLTVVVGCVYCRKRKGPTINRLNRKNTDLETDTEYIYLPIDPGDIEVQSNNVDISIDVNTDPKQDVDVPNNVNSENQTDQTMRKSDTSFTGRQDGRLCQGNDKNKYTDKELSSRKNKHMKPMLNYVEIAFDSARQDVKFNIRGDSSRTPYADIDLTLKADPLPESDISDDDVDDDDFMTLHDIEMMMTKT